MILNCFEAALHHWKHFNETAPIQILSVNAVHLGERLYRCDLSARGSSLQKPFWNFLKPLSRLSLIVILVALRMESKKSGTLLSVGRPFFIVTPSYSFLSHHIKTFSLLSCPMTAFRHHLENIKWFAKVTPMFSSFWLVIDFSVDDPD